MEHPALEPQTLARHCNEGLILAVLAGGPRHGYQLALEIETRSDGYFRLHHGTLYPILHKLEKEGLIRGRWTTEGPRGQRRQYALTGKGRRHLRAQTTAWREFAGRLLGILEDSRP